MARHWTLPQKDLFEPSPPVSQLMETERRKALDLLRVGGSDESRAGDGDQQPRGGAR